MAQPGRRPIPTQLKIIKGTDQPCRMQKDEPKPATNNIKMPPGLSKDAKKHWRIISKRLIAAKILTEIDTDALAMYCESWAVWWDATKKVNEHGSVVEGQNGYAVQSPYFLIANKAHNQMRQMATEFGMTPSSRTRVAATSSPDDDNPFAD